MKIKFAVLFLFYVNFCLSQELTDEIKSQILRKDTNAVILLLKLSEENRSNDPDKAMEFSNQAIELAVQLRYKKGFVDGYLERGNLFLDKADYFSSLVSLKKVYDFSNVNDYKYGLAHYYYSMYTVYFSQARYTECVTNLIKAIDLAEEIHDETFAASCYLGIGSIYNMLLNFELARVNFEKAMDVYKKLNDTAGVGLSHVYLANIEMAEGKPSQALSKLMIALELYTSINDSKGMALAYRTLGRAYLKENKLQEAEEYTRKAIKIYDESGNKDGLIFCYGTLGQVKAKQKKYEEARSDLNLAIKNATESGQLNHLKNNYLNLSSLDSSQGKFRDAYENYKRYFVYYDSIYSHANTQKITEQKMEYLFERKQAADSIAFAHEKEIVKLQLKDQRIISFMGFGISLVTLILLTFVIISYRKQKKAMIQLRETQDQLVKSEKLAAFGVMASRVSHEIQNPLNFVNNFSLMSKDLVNDVINGNTISERKECGEMLLSNLLKIHEHGTRAALIIKNLQEHSRRGTAHYFFEK